MRKRKRDDLESAANTSVAPTSGDEVSESDEEEFEGLSSDVEPDPEETPAERADESTGNAAEDMILLEDSSEEDGEEDEEEEDGEEDEEEDEDDDVDSGGEGSQDEDDLELEERPLVESDEEVPDNVPKPKRRKKTR